MQLVTLDTSMHQRLRQKLRYALCTPGDDRPAFASDEAWMAVTPSSIGALGVLFYRPDLDVALAAIDADAGVVTPALQVQIDRQKASDLGVRVEF